MPASTGSAGAAAGPRWSASRASMPSLGRELPQCSPGAAATRGCGSGAPPPSRRAEERAARLGSRSGRVEAFVDEHDRRRVLRHAARGRPRTSRTCRRLDLRERRVAFHGRRSGIRADVLMRSRFSRVAREMVRPTHRRIHEYPPPTPPSARRRYDPGDLETTLRVLATLLRGRPIDQDDPAAFETVRHATAEDVQGRQGRYGGSRKRTSSRTPTGASPRRRPGAPEPASTTTRCRLVAPTPRRRRAAGRAALLTTVPPWSDAFLPPAVPRARAAVRREARRAHQPSGQGARPLLHRQAARRFGKDVSSRCRGYSPRRRARPRSPPCRTGMPRGAFAAMPDAADLAPPPEDGGGRSTSRPRAGHHARRRRGRFAGPLDILVDNAAQTVGAGSPGSYSHPGQTILAPLPERADPDFVTASATRRRAPPRPFADSVFEPAHRALVGALRRHDDRRTSPRAQRSRRVRSRSARTTPTRAAAINAGGLVPDLHHEKAWSAVRAGRRPARDAPRCSSATRPRRSSSE